MKQQSPEPFERRDPIVKPEASINGGWGGPSHNFRHDSFSALSPKSLENDDDYADQETTEMLDRRCSFVYPWEFAFYMCVCVCILHVFVQ